MKRNSDHELSDEDKLSFRKSVRNPVLFATHFLGVDLWPRETEILQSIATHPKTAVRACHGVGKTFTLAVATLWWLVRYHDGIVLTTAPTQRQVNTQLWSEIHRLADRSRVQYPKLRKTELKFRDDRNFAIGFSTNQAANFQGYHGEHLLIIADEAPGIEPDVWDAVYGTMAGGKGHIVMAGNPTIPSGIFFDAFTKDRALWTCLTIGALDSPNLKGLSLAGNMKKGSSSCSQMVRLQLHHYTTGLDPFFMLPVRYRSASAVAFTMLWLQVSNEGNRCARGVEVDSVSTV